MEARQSANDQAIGKVELVAFNDERLRSRKPDRLIVEQSRYNWRPPKSLANRLPPWLDLAFKVELGIDGVRRFSPAQNTLDFIKQAAFAGREILIARGEIDRGDDLHFSPNESRLFYNYSRHLREYLGKTIQLENAIRIAFKGRTDSTTSDILPEELGLDIRGKGKRWTVTRLFAEGRKSAQIAGIVRPTLSDQFRYGIVAAARLCPILESDPAKIESSIRMAMFAGSPSSRLKNLDDMRYIVSHVRSSLEDHLNDDAESFARWTEDRQANLIHRISKRADCELSRDEVRTGLVELGWQSVLKLGLEVDTWTSAFRDALPCELNDTERSIFDSGYVCQPCFGNLPLVILFERLDFLKETVVAVWERPGDLERLGILYRLIFWYATMVGLLFNF